MKKINFARIAILVLSLALLVGAAFSISVAAEETASTGEFGAISLAYGDNVSLQVVVDATQEEIENGDVVVTYSINGDDPVNAKYYRTTEDGRVWVITEGIAVYNLAQPVTFNSYVGDTHVEKDRTCSAAQFIYVRLHHDSTTTEAYKLLYKELLEYAAAAQTALNKNTDNLITNSTLVKTNNADVTVNGKSYAFAPGAGLNVTPVWGGTVPAGQCLSGWKVVKDGAEETVGLSFDCSGVVEITEPVFAAHPYVDDNNDHICDCGCGEQISDHVYGEWTTVIAPTYDADGLEKQTCKCGDVKEQAIPKLVPVASIDFAKDLHNIVLGVNDTVTLNVTIFPDNASNKTLTWTSTDDSVATVVDGVITGHKEGFVNVVATDDRGLVSKMAYIYVTSTAIDGAIADELYADSIPSYSSKEGRDQVTKVVLSEGGFYLVYDVTDPDIVTDSHLELYLSFGNSPKEIGKAFELRYYPLRDDLPNGAAYAWNGSEWAGITNTFRMYSKTVPVTDADDKITGYISETFVPYSSVGLDEAPEYLELLSVQFYWLNNSMHCGHGGEVWFFMAHLDNFDYFKQYNKDGYVDDVFVEVDFNGGKIENSGSSTDATVGAYLPGGGTGNKNSTEFIPADNVTFVNGVDGAENGAISSKHYSGPYTVVDGVTLGTADFTVSTWINIPEDAILSTGNQTFIFGTKPADSSRTDGFFCTIRKTTDGSYTIIVNAAEKGAQWLQNVNFKQGEWNLITLVRKSDELRFYLNDQLLHTWYFSNQDFGAYDIVFGGQLGEAWPYMDQVMIFDNVRIYKRALAINELTEICKNDVAK